MSIAPRDEQELVINEIVSAPGDAGRDWVELYVAGAGPVDTASFRLVDDNPDHEPYQLPGQVLMPGDFLVVRRAGDDEAGFSFGLGGDDTVTLLRDGQTVDTLSWARGESLAGLSFGRLPDGSGEGRLLQPTPGAANRAPEASPTRLFDTERVVSVRLELDAQSWSAIQNDPLAETYYAGDIVYGETRVENVAIRVKGNSSLRSVARSSSKRFSFKVDLNRNVAGQTLLGAKKLNLNNGFKDPTMMREHLAYDVFRRAGLPAPRTAFVDLTVAGEHMGLYTLVEQIDGDFLERHFGEGDGDLYKPEPPAGSLRYLGARFEDYQGANPENNEDTTDHAAFLRFVEVLNDPSAGDLSEVLNVDVLLQNLAVHVVLVNLDSYLGMGHNFYLYEQAGRFRDIPWDLNEAYANFTCQCNRDGLVGLFIDEPTCGPLADRPLLARIFAEEEYVQRYHEHLRILVEGVASAAVMGTLIEATANLIRPYVEADPTKFYSVEEFEAGLTSDVGDRQRSLGLSTFIRDRNAHILRQLAGETARSNEGLGNCGGRNGGMEPGGGMDPGGGRNCPPCGDGECDDAERDNPALCPRDCQAPPPGGDWCGDGVCDALEACEMSCPVDCIQ